MKKVFPIFLAFVLCLILSTSAFADISVSDDKMKEIILEKYSFSEDFVNDLSYEDLQKYYKNSYQILNSTKTETYIKFKYDMSEPKKPKEISQTKATKKEYELSLNQPAIQTRCGISSGYDCIQEGWVKLETYISKTSSDEGNVSARFQWLKAPYFKETDVLAIGLNSNFSPVPGTESASYTYEIWDGILRTISYGIASKRDSGGYAYKIELLDNLSASFPFGRHSEIFRGYMQYDFIKISEDAKAVDAFSHYAHQETHKHLNVSISMPVGGGFSLSNQTKFDILTGHAQLKW
ncbi:hypothetical protein MH117_05185 [Paenibacillus sp. ACRRX]|uniref:hypothetical protein n=1 Tax=Paenibacillus sp. ACRRX TaxID=2918206 RepID=UPI001EF5BD9C|nr:hypothetical protein [Paenibacillus sp. ACRRX]MCG7406805.1 hypothetical protein [Paenibacillus sp. ACRRX]